MIAAYTRVSSQSQTTDSQRAEITRWLQSHGIDLTEVQWFEDRVTGTTTRRPALDRLQSAIFAGEVEMVVVWKLDRLSRKAMDGMTLLGKWFEQSVRLVSVTQQIDLSGAVGQMVASLLFGVAEIEQEYRRERQTEGIAVARDRGAYKGRKKGTTKTKPQRALELRDTANHRRDRPLFGRGPHNHLQLPQRRQEALTNIRLH